MSAASFPDGVVAGEHFRQGLCFQSQSGQLLTDVVVQILRDASLDLLGNRQQVLFELGTLDDPAQLQADADHCVGNPAIGLDHLIGEEFQHGCHLITQQHGEGDGGANAQFFGYEWRSIKSPRRSVVHSSLPLANTRPGRP